MCRLVEVGIDISLSCWCDVEKYHTHIYLPRSCPSQTKAIFMFYEYCYLGTKRMKKLKSLMLHVQNGWVPKKILCMIPASPILDPLAVFWRFASLSLSEISSSCQIKLKLWSTIMISQNKLPTIYGDTSARNLFPRPPLSPFRFLSPFRLQNSVEFVHLVF